MTTKERELLRMIPLIRMEAKSDLEKLRYMMLATGKNYEREINRVLDRINSLNKLEEELMFK